MAFPSKRRKDAPCDICPAPHPGALTKVRRTSSPSIRSTNRSTSSTVQLWPGLQSRFQQGPRSGREHGQRDEFHLPGQLHAAAAVLELADRSWSKALGGCFGRIPQRDSPGFCREGSVGQTRRGAFLTNRRQYIFPTILRPTLYSIMPHWSPVPDSFRPLSEGIVSFRSHD